MNDHDRIITDTAEVLWDIAENPSVPDAVRNAAGARCAQLRDLLPKPRFYAGGRSTYDRDQQGFQIAYVGVCTVPDDATAHLIAQDIAASYNQRLGEVEA